MGTLQAQPSLEEGKNLVEVTLPFVRLDQGRELLLIYDDDEPEDCLRR